MSERFFADTPIAADRAILSGPEAHHLTHVMRVKVGEMVTLFDGSGSEFTAQVLSIGRREVQLTVLERREVDRELPVQLVLGVSLPKGERQKWLVEKGVELGIGRIVPLRTARSVAQPGPEALARLRRSVIEASKQCGRNRLLELAEPQTWPEFLAATAGAPLRWIAHPLGGEQGAGDRGQASEEMVLAVGPEGGFADEEVLLATGAGWTLVDLGPRILRVETAAIVLAALAAGIGVRHHGIQGARKNP